MHSAIYYNSKLRALSNAKIAQKKQKEIKGIRGVRGISNQDLIALINEEVWPSLPEDSDTLHMLYGTAHEDGLLAIALLAVAALESPNEALQLVERWLPFLDNTETADFIGHLIIGPSAFALQESITDRITEQENPYAIRAELNSCLAAFPTPAKGVCVAGLRKKFAVDDVIFVEEPHLDWVHEAVSCTMRMEHPLIKKALRNIIYCWASWKPDDVEEFFTSNYPNWPNWMKDAWKKGRKKSKRRGL